MSIERIHNLSHNVLSSEKPFSKTVNTVDNQTEYSNEVVAQNTANAIIAKNSPENNDYIFIKNINIPALNLNANLYQLKNGQKCIIAKKDGPCVLKTYFKVGSMNEPDNLRGISHFIEHNLFNGSKNLKPTEFVMNVNQMGGKYNASTGLISTDYFIQSPLHNDNDLEKFIKMHADMIINPSFAEAMLEKEKGPVISEIQMLADNPINIATNIALKNLFAIKTLSTDIIGGSVKNIENISRNDVLNYYKTNYTPESALTIVIGDIDEKKTLNLLSENFKNFKVHNEKQLKYHEKLNPISNSIREDTSSANTQATEIHLAFKGPKNNQDKIVTSVMLYALAGYKNARLTKEMKKYNLNILAGLEPISNIPENPTAIMLQTSTPSNNHEEILELIYKNIHNMAYKPISDEELKIIKTKILGQLKYSSESNMELATILGSNYINENNFNTIANYEKRINTISKEDIMLAAREFLDLNKVSIALVHPKKQISFSGNQKIKYDIKTYKTANNATITTLNNPNSKTYALSIELKSPTIPDKSPLALILSNMLAKGTSLMSESDFYKIEDNNNISSSISTDYNKIIADYSFPKESLNSALNNYKINVFYPALTQENFAKAKEEIRNLYLSNPKSATHRANEILYKGTPRCYSLRKIFMELDSVKYEDIINYYNMFMQNAECKISASGDFSKQDALNIINENILGINKIFSKPNSKSSLNINNLEKNQVVCEAQERNQADIVQKFRIKETGNIKDKAAILLLNEVLGGNSNSRLFNDLREKQKLAYRVNSSYVSSENEGVLTLRIFTTTKDSQNPEQYKNLQKALDGFGKHIKNLKTKQISLDELNAAKLQIKSNILFGLESTVGKNAILHVGMNSLYKEKYLQELLNAIDMTSVDDIQKIAQHYLAIPSVISIIASENTLKNNDAYLKTLGEYQKFC